MRPGGGESFHKVWYVPVIGEELCLILPEGCSYGERKTIPKIHANGVELYYELYGLEDGEVLALSNGILMSTASRDLKKAALSSRHRLLLYDCRGM